MMTQEETMGTMADFVARHNIKIACEWADRNPHMPDWNDANHYKCKITMGCKQVTIYFSQGYGVTHEPEAADVLNCLADDSAGVSNARSFEEWADEYGYDTDSRKAEKTYNVCVKQAAGLLSFLGEDLYNELLWETERL
jgi:hypothetical protein